MKNHKRLLRIFYSLILLVHNFVTTQCWFSLHILCKKDVSRSEWRDIYWIRPWYWPPPKKFSCRQKHFYVAQKKYFVSKRTFFLSGVSYFSFYLHSFEILHQMVIKPLAFGIRLPAKWEQVNNSLMLRSESKIRTATYKNNKNQCFLKKDLFWSSEYTSCQQAFRNHWWWIDELFLWYGWSARQKAIRGSRHRDSSTRRKEDLNLDRIWLQG